ncbi:MAG: hypothetical protein ABRQ38_06065 [Candidatus Eremiobacterota bacterium]
MSLEIYRQIINGEDIKKIINLPEYLTDKELEITLKPVKERYFNSLSLIKINTEEFKFNRDMANER